MADMNRMEILMVIDQSGSMGQLRGSTISGFNEFLEAQKKANDGKQRFLTVVLFNTEFTELHVSTAVADMPLMTPEWYRPDGCTALFDAVGRTIDRAGNRFTCMPPEARPGLVQLVIMTDGLENASKEYDRDAVRSRIEHQRSNYGWDVIYLGQHKGTFEQAASIGIKVDCSVQLFASESATKAAYAGVAKRSRHFAQSGAGGQMCSMSSYVDRDAVDASSGQEPGPEARRYKVLFDQIATPGVTIGNPDAVAKVVIQEPADGDAANT